MTRLRQQILILHLAVSSLEGRTVAWAFFDGTLAADQPQMQSGDTEKPPYESVLAAMRDGWMVIQLPTLPVYVPGHEHESGHLPYEYVLERKVDLDSL
ncbi:MAG: hypothetical protein JWP00_1899 [Chloroflexi bacterium]|jgi:hypothetical protein|nr:hypothetical protein [Chloroflexota bacterium]